MRDSKYNMSVRYFKHVSFDLLSPSDSIAPGAGRTEPVFTVMVNFRSFSTVGTGINVYTQSCCPAYSYIPYCFILFGLDKVFRILTINVPPLVEESSEAELFLTKPVVFFLCMNSTFTHAARVFERTSSTTHGSGPVANTKLHEKSELAGKKYLFSYFNLVRKNQIINFFQAGITNNRFFSVTTFGT